MAKQRASKWPDDIEITKIERTDKIDTIEDTSVDLEELVPEVIDIEVVDIEVIDSQ